MTDQQSEHSLGDGVYVRVTRLGDVCLRQRRLACDSAIYLEPAVLAEFERWLKHLRKARRESAK